MLAAELFRYQHVTKSRLDAVPFGTGSLPLLAGR